MTECNSQIDLFSIGRRAVTATFDGAQISSNGGLLLAGQIEGRLGLCARMSAALLDGRDPRYVQHTTEDLLRQRVLQIVAGYEDANDATQLRRDAALQTAMGYVPGEQDSVLASQPTLSRFERRSPRELAAMARTQADGWVARIARLGRKHVSLELDSTEDVTHGAQQLSMFNGHYGATVYHPLLVFDGEGYPIVALLRPGNVHSGRGALALVRFILKRLRRALPHVKVTLRADAGFATPKMYEICEQNDVTYFIAQTVHQKYKEMTEPLVALGCELADAAGESIKVYDEFRYRAQTWNRERRIIAKAECSATASHVRYVVTNSESGTPEDVYGTYSGRGQSENYIKDLKNAMFGDRLSCTDFWSNQFRLLIHTLAYVVLFELRELMSSTALARVQLDTLRLRLIKIGASITVTARRIWVRLSATDPASVLFRTAASALAVPT